MTQSREPAHANDQNQQLNLSESIMVGGIVGAFSVVFDQPLWVMKVRQQNGSAFTFNPMILYRGALTNAASTMPITALQVGLKQGYQKYFYPNLEGTVKQNLISSFAAGMGSSFVSSPTELVMLHQAKFRLGFFPTVQKLIANGGVNILFKGLTATAMREGIFTVFFLGITPLLKSYLKPYINNDNAASIIAGLGAGMAASPASQWVDTIKTAQQESALYKSTSLVHTAKEIYNSGGIYSFFKGLAPRGGQMMVGVCAMALAYEKLEAYIKPKK